MLKPVFIFVAILWMTAIATATRADWMNLTGAETAPNIAEITVLDDGVLVKLEVYIGDLATFEALVPDEWLKKAITDRPPQSERLHQFSSETLQILTSEGTKLQAELTLVEPRLRKDRTSAFAGMINPMTRQRVPGPPEDKRVLYAELVYPFSGKPDSLTISPPQNDSGIPAVTIGFIAYHKSVPIIDFRYLSQSATVALDWDDPWYSKFDNPNLKRHHKSALMSFLYVEPREVRHEVLIRVRDLEEWTDLDLSGNTIDSADQNRIKEHARTFFASRNPLNIDDTPALPASTRAEFLNISLTGLQVIEEDIPLDLSTAIMGIILSYPVRHLPQNISVQWDLFSDRVKRIPATAIDPAGPLPSFIEIRDPILEWRNFLRTYEEPQVTPVVVDDGRSISVPLLSVLLLALALSAFMLSIRPVFLSRVVWAAVCAACFVAAVLLFRVGVVNVAIPFAGPPDNTTSVQILSGVLTNVSHAHLETDPAELRRALEVVVAAEALADVEDELDRALAIRVVGGGIARVNAIEDMTLKEITALDGRRGFRSLAEWTVKASAGHWGHVHQRTIRFRALVELVDDSDAWKLAGITVVDAKQLN
ncbi:MAG: hypothetical protein QNI91_12420 [Arenicellales bacterium]|nr:hypothetical protein [Arenicellales bacterium]